MFLHQVTGEFHACLFVASCLGSWRIFCANGLVACWTISWFLCFFGGHRTFTLSFAFLCFFFVFCFFLFLALVHLKLWTTKESGLLFAMMWPKMVVVSLAILRTSTELSQLLQWDCPIIVVTVFEEKHIVPLDFSSKLL